MNTNTAPLARTTVPAAEVVRDDLVFVDAITDTLMRVEWVVRLTEQQVRIVGWVDGYGRTDKVVGGWWAPTVDVYGTPGVDKMREVLAELGWV